MYKTTKALVLREVKYKEADKILTVLTEDEGKLTVKARGAMRKSCRFAAASQCFAFSEMTLFGSKGRWSVNEAAVIEQFLGLREDIAALSLASYFASALESVSDEDRANPAVLQLGLNSLFALSRGVYPQERIKSVFELRLMCIAGFEPQVSACPACGKEEPDGPLLSLLGGVVHCAGCNPGAAGKSARLCPDSLAAVRYIISAPAKSVFSFTIPDGAEKLLASACEEYMHEQLGHGFRALDYYNTIKLG